MREILFKAISQNFGWTKGYYVVQDTGITDFIIPVGDCDKRLIIIIPETLCQYTGFTDKNGKMIFESDIVVAYNEDGTKIKWVVSFQFGSWIIETEKVWDFLATNARSIEVIGNIHDEEERA